MATGPEHYQEAERLALTVTTPDTVNPQKRILRSDADPVVVALAQVHATLAHAAATAMGMVDLPAADWDHWRAAASAYTRPQPEPADSEGGPE